MMQFGVKLASLASVALSLVLYKPPVETTKTSDQHGSNKLKTEMEQLAFTTRTSGLQSSKDASTPSVASAVPCDVRGHENPAFVISERCSYV